MIKLGADPNAQDNDGNTPLHLVIQCFADKPQSFENLKNIGKELLFSGASRTIQNKNGEIPRDIFLRNSSLLQEDAVKKMTYVLTQPTGMGLLQTTRPIEKVERKSTI